MKFFGKNVGRHDAESRQVAALLLGAGGITALPAVYDDISWLVWLLGAAMVALGVRYIWLGMKGCGTTLFGVVLDLFGVAAVALAAVGDGVVAFVAGLVLALVGWVTAAAGRCPVNALLGLDTRDAASAGPAAPAVTGPTPAKH